MIKLSSYDRAGKFLDTRVKEDGTYTPQDVRDALEAGGVTGKGQTSVRSIISFSAAYKAWHRKHSGRTVIMVGGMEGIPEVQEAPRGPIQKVVGRPGTMKVVCSCQDEFESWHKWQEHYKATTPRISDESSIGERLVLLEAHHIEHKAQEVRVQ